MRKNILIALKTTQRGNKIKMILTSHGYQVGQIVEDAYSALRALRTKRFDLSIIDNELRGLNALQLAKIIDDESLGPVIILAKSPIDTGESPPASLFGVLIKPLTEYQLLNTLKLAFLQYERKLNLEKEIESLRDALATRKVLERAKGLLMDKYNLSEDEAYRRLRNEAMEKRLKLKEIAEAIVLQAEH